MFELEQFPELAPDQREAIADAHRAVDKLARTLVADLTQHDHAMQRMRDNVNELTAAWGVVPAEMRVSCFMMSDVIAAFLRERDALRARIRIMSELLPEPPHPASGPSSPAGAPGQVDGPTPAASPAHQLYVEYAGDTRVEDEVASPRIVLCGDREAVIAFIRKHPLFTFMQVQP